MSSHSICLFICVCMIHLILQLETIYTYTPSLSLSLSVRCHIYNMDCGLKAHCRHQFLMNFKSWLDLPPTTSEAPLFAKQNWMPKLKLFGTLTTFWFADVFFFFFLQSVSEIILTSDSRESLVFRICRVRGLTLFPEKQMFGWCCCFSIALSKPSLIHFGKEGM